MEFNIGDRVRDVQGWMNQNGEVIGLIAVAGNIRYEVRWPNGLRGIYVESSLEAMPKPPSTLFKVGDRVIVRGKERGFITSITDSADYPYRVDFSYPHRGWSVYADEDLALVPSDEPPTNPDTYEQVGKEMASLREIADSIYMEDHYHQAEPIYRALDMLRRYRDTLPRQSKGY